MSGVSSNRARAALMLGAAIAAAYGNSMWGAFQFDDYNVIVLNPAVHDVSAWLHELPHGIRPMLKLTYVLNWITSAQAPGFHLLNIAVHVVNALLAWALARMLAQELGPRAARHCDAAAVTAALLFGLHPAQTEAVTYISGRSSALMATFYLGSFLAYVHAIRGERKHLLYVVSPMLFVLALSTKEVALTLPGALVLWEWCRRGDSRDWHRVARHQVVHWIVLAIAAGALFAHPIYGPRLASQWDAAAIYANVLTQINGIFYLVLRLVWIYPLNIDPDLPNLSAWTMPLVAKCAALCAMAAVATWGMRHRPWLAFGLLWFLLQFVPAVIAGRFDVANERELYLPSFGIFFALAIELQCACEAGRKWLQPAGVGAIVLLAIFTVVRNEDYRSEVRLWEQTARGSTHKPRVFNNLGYAYRWAGCPLEAERAYRTALRLRPDYALAHDNLMHLLQAHTGPEPASDPHCR